MIPPKKDFLQSGPDGMANQVPHMDAWAKTQDSQSRPALLERA
jgi:hypothetical protein